jgi:hypothetical protein
VRNDAATTISGSALIQREIIPRMTTESSTSITRSGSCCVELGAAELVNPTLITHQTRLKRHDKQKPMAIQPPDRWTQIS